MGFITPHKTGYQGAVEVIKEEFEKVFDQPSTQLGVGITNVHKTEKVSHWQPFAQVFETEKEYHLKISLPGVEERNIVLIMDPNNITVQGENSFEEVIKEEQIFLNEFSYGKFERHLYFKKSIIVDDVIYNLKNGILTIILPKKEKEEPKTVRLTQ